MGTPASGVVGQPNFTSPGSGCNGILSAPTYVVASSQGLYVSDTGNSRVVCNSTLQKRQFFLTNAICSFFIQKINWV